MTDLVDNEYGIENEKIEIKKLRIFRNGQQWLVEYRRVPRLWAPWDYFWWYNDGMYIDYQDAVARVSYLKADGCVIIPRFQKVKEFVIE